MSSAVFDIDDFRGTVELGLGHYGPDLVGVARFYDAFGRPYTPCPCSIVESRGVRIGDGAFTAVSDNCTLSTWLWNLVIDLDGDVSALNGTIATDTGLEATVSFEQVDDFVDDAFKVCEP